ncbi:MAG: WYL domain-containing protein, partial [Spirochaetes bacterium]|nr:WYL domain-containing protein [Spirochaetota bacterium]
MKSFERHFFIHRKIVNSGRVTLEQIVDQFQVSKRTAIRDIEDMRMVFQAPIVYSRQLKGYVYDQEFEAFNFSDERLLIFYAFLKSITKKELNYIPFVSDNLLSYISNNISSSFRKLSDNINYELSMYEQLSIHMFRDLLYSMLDQQQCMITYTNTEGEKSVRHIEPYKLINYFGIWYLIAYCHRSTDIRVFVMSRIISVSKTKKGYESQYSDKQIDQIARQGFGIIRGKEAKNVTIRFYGKAYFIIKNQ